MSSQGGLDPARLVAIDESEAKTNRTRCAASGFTLPPPATGGPSPISSIRLDGTESLRAHVEAILCLSLKEGGIVSYFNEEWKCIEER